MAKKKKCSGKTTLHECGKNATVLLDEEWDELLRTKGKNAGELYTVTEENAIIHVRIPKNLIHAGNELKVRVFLEKAETGA